MCHSTSLVHLRVTSTHHNRFLMVLFLPMMLLANNVFALNLQQAEHLAVQADPAIEKFKATSLSYANSSIADDTLPDPKLRLGAVNVPVDTFDLEQEQMTQIKVGIQQDHPLAHVLCQQIEIQRQRLRCCGTQNIEIALA